MRENFIKDYRHSFHAGNVGDVWKHTALLSLLHPLLKTPEPIDVLDTHSGEGFYSFQSTGEWTAGIGQLWDHGLTQCAPVDRYVEQVAQITKRNRRAYPGSPSLIASLLRSQDSATFCETRDDAFDILQKTIGTKGRAIHGDGFQTLAKGGKKGSRWVVHIDPPYADKEEWVSTPDAIALAAKLGAIVIAWYPIKSLARPNAMLNRLRESKTPAIAIDLCVTPVEIKRPALAGSGVVLVGAAPSVLSELHDAASTIGPICATHEGRWFLRTTAWK